MAAASLVSSLRVLASAAVRDGAVGSVVLHRSASAALAASSSPVVSSPNQFSETLHALPTAGIALLELRSARTANAMSAFMMLEFHARVRELEALGSAAADSLGGESSLRGVVVSGALDGSAFCGGADLNGVALRESASGAAMRVVMSDACSRLARCGLVSVAALGGPAIGGGAELATAPDFRIMTAGASLDFVHVRRGVVPAWGGATRLLSLLPRQKALWLLASGAPMHAHLAAQLGIADLVLDAEFGEGARTAAAASAAFLQRLLWHEDAQGVASDSALRATKRLVASIAAGDGLAAEARELDRLWDGPVQREAVRSWAAGRAKRKEAAVAATAAPTTSSE